MNRMVNKSLRILLVIMLWLTLGSWARADENISLAWDADASGSVAGYVIYYGNASQNYTSRVDVGTNVSASLASFQTGSTNYFAVTAYDSTGTESAPSSELVYVVPVMLHMTPPSVSGGAMSFQFSAVTGHWYELQATTDFKTWTTICQTTTATTYGQMSFADSKSRAFPSRYYRLAVH